MNTHTIDRTTAEFPATLPAQPTEIDPWAPFAKNWSARRELAKTGQIDPSKAQNTFEALDKTLPDKDAYLAWVAAYKRAIRELERDIRTLKIAKRTGKPWRDRLGELHALQFEIAASSFKARMMNNLRIITKTWSQAKKREQ